METVRRQVARRTFVILRQAFCWAFCVGRRASPKEFFIALDFAKQPPEKSGYGTI